MSQTPLASHTPIRRGRSAAMGHSRLKCLALSAVMTLALCALIACGGNPAPSGPAQEFSSPAPALLAPTPTPAIFGGSGAHNPIWNVSPSIYEQIFTSSVIVRASLLSATAGTETVASGEGVAPTYRAVQELRFTAHEYLKGTGPAVAIVVVRSDHTYLTEAEARQVADSSVAQRNTTWDGRQAVLFLQTLAPPYTPGSSGSGAAGQTPAPSFAFTLSNYEQSEWAYSIDTLSRAWLPANNAGSASGQPEVSGTATFITDGSQSPPPSVSLAKLRSRIAEINAMLRAGEGIEGYEDCIYHKLTRERHFRNDPYIPLVYGIALTSGSAAGIEIYRDTYFDSKYLAFWLSGPDAELFQTSVIDDDTSAQNGYDHTITTVRPLTARAYRVFYHQQHWRYFPCNFKPDDAYDDWTVTVTAPPGTLHEAFFDPGEAGAEVGFPGASGVLKPAGFSVGNTATEITGLSWQTGSVSLTLSKYVSLDGYSLDFYGLDGKMMLSLDGNDAAADAAAGTLTWRAASQPWQDGDMLMLRIRQRDTVSER